MHTVFLWVETLFSLTEKQLELSFFFLLTLYDMTSSIGKFYPTKLKVHFSLQPHTIFINMAVDLSV